MPRPKVHQSQRQRAAEACDYCREAKKRCSGSAPCTQCVQRGLSETCFITYLPRGTRTKSNIAKAKADFVKSRPPPQARPAANASAASQRSYGGESAGDEGFYPLSPSDSRQGGHEAGSMRNEASLEPLGTSPNTMSPEEESRLAVNAPRMLRSNLGEPGKGVEDQEVTKQD